MDDILGSGWSNWAGSSPYLATTLVFDQGYAFLGYPFLAQLAQVAEYRRISEVIATEMTRRWIKIQSTADETVKKKNNGDLPKDHESKEEKIKALEAALNRFNIQSLFRQLAEQDGLYGRSHLYIDTGHTEDRDELVTPIGDGTTRATLTKIKKGGIKAFKVVEAIWSYPTTYEASNPLKRDWYKPTSWFVMGTEIHSSRFLTFIGREVPDLLKPAYAFGGMSLSQMAKAYVDNWLRTRQSVSDLLKAFTVWVLKTNLSGGLSGAQDTGSDYMFDRADLFNNMRNNRGLMMVDKDNEDFENVSAQIAGLHELQAQSQEQICSVSAIPLVKYTGISPSGLNASSEGEIRVFYDTIHAHQEKFFRPGLDVVFRLVQLSEFGAIDPDLVYDFEPLWSLDDKQLADKRKTDGDTDCAYIDRGVLDPVEVRRRLAADPDSPYASLDVEDVPEPSGPEPENIRERIEENEPGKTDVTAKHREAA